MTQASQTERVHELKTWPQFFKSIKGGTKLFELRKNDRDFRVGDKLLLREFEPVYATYSGDSLIVDVLYVLDLSGYGLPDYCIMSIQRCPATQTERQDITERLAELKLTQVLNGTARAFIDEGIAEIRRLRSQPSRDGMERAARVVEGRKDGIYRHWSFWEGNRAGGDIVLSFANDAAAAIRALSAQPAQPERVKVAWGGPVIITWRALTDPALVKIAAERRAVLFRFGDHLATVYLPRDGAVWHSTYDNRPIDTAGAAKPTAWADLRDVTVRLALGLGVGP